MTRLVHLMVPNIKLVISQTCNTLIGNTNFQFFSFFPFVFLQVPSFSHSPVAEHCQLLIDLFSQLTVHCLIR